MDLWRDDQAVINAQRHLENTGGIRENREAIGRVADAIHRQDENAEQADKQRLIKLDNMDTQLAKIALQTARDDGKREARGKIVTVIGNIILAAISGGALVGIYQAVAWVFRRLGLPGH